MKWPQFTSCWARSLRETQISPVSNLMESIENIDNYGAHNKFYLYKHSLLWKPCDFCHLNTLEQIEIWLIQDKQQEPNLCI